MRAGWTSHAWTKQQCTILRGMASSTSPTAQQTWRLSTALAHTAGLTTQQCPCPTLSFLRQLWENTQMDLGVTRQEYTDFTSTRPSGTLMTVSHWWIWVRYERNCTIAALNRSFECTKAPLFYGIFFAITFLAKRQWRNPYQKQALMWALQLRNLKRKRKEKESWFWCATVVRIVRFVPACHVVLYLWFLEVELKVQMQSSHISVHPRWGSRVQNTRT